MISTTRTLVCDAGKEWSLRVLVFWLIRTMKPICRAWINQGRATKLHPESHSGYYQSSVHVREVSDTNLFVLRRMGFGLDPLSIEILDAKEAKKVS